MYQFQVLEGLINTLLHDVPVPSPGRSVRFWCLGEAMTISMPKVPKELPLFDYDLLEFFHILGVENAVKLIVCALLEHQILVGNSKAKFESAAQLFIFQILETFRCTLATWTS